METLLEREGAVRTGEIFMKKTVIFFGASKLGKCALELIGTKQERVLFCDNNPDFIGKKVHGVEVISPSKLMREFPDARIIITSWAYDEISHQLEAGGISQYEVFSFELAKQSALIDQTETENELPEIEILDLGAFLCFFQSVKYGLGKDRSQITLTDRTFLPGGTVFLLDHALLQAIAISFNRKHYLEIGTFIGESITAVADYVETCESISLDDSADEDWFKYLGMKNFSRYFLKDIPNLVCHIANSTEFDFNNFKHTPDLVFIDGGHDYDTVHSDTEKIFSSIGDDAIIVWHDFFDDSHKLRSDVVRAIFDALKSKYTKNIFGFDIGYCGIYLPEKYHSYFIQVPQVNNILTSYDIVIKKVNRHHP